MTSERKAPGPASAPRDGGVAGARFGVIVLATAISVSGVARSEPSPPAAAVSPTRAGEAEPKVRVRGSPIYLWCADPSGNGCDRAASVLGVLPVPASGVPRELLVGFQDNPDDCHEPALRDLVERLSSALGLDPDAWSDQVGSELPPEGLDERYLGGGCITMTNRALPTVKIHAGAGPGSQLVLVRVWEAEAP